MCGQRPTEVFSVTPVALSCKRFAGEHSHERILEMITKIHSDFNFNSSKITATVTDNGSNFVKAFKEFGVENDNDEDVPESVDVPHLPKHIRCASHTLNLLATTDFLKIVESDDNLNAQHKQVRT